MYMNIKMFRMMGFVAALFFPNVSLWHAADRILCALTENGKKVAVFLWMTDA